MTHKITGIVLAAGTSDRMGQPKQLLPFRDSTLVGTVVGTAESSQLDDVIVVVGANAAEVSASLEPERALVVVNREFADGNLSSLRTGLEAAGECDAAVLLLADMPEVTAAVIDALVDGWRHAPAVVAVVRYADGIGHPFLLSAPAIAGVAGLQGRKPLWAYVSALDPSDRLEIAVPGSAPRDIDTPDDYAALLESEGA